MKMILSAFLALALPALASRTPDQCPTPGQVLNREFIGLSGDPVKSSFYRDGTAEISTSGVLNGTLKTNTYKDFKVSKCEARTENYQEEVCVNVDLDVALGRGNELFKSFFDLNATLLKRAQLFTSSVVFSMDQTPVVRLDFAKQIVVQMARNASVMGIPRSWEAFSALIGKAVADGYITQAVHDDLITLNLVANSKKLGFAPLEGVRFSEGTGNGKLQKLFDLTVSSQVRATLIQTTLDGLSEKTSLALSKSFIDFATANGIPENWSQFMMMMKESLAAGAIPQDEFLFVTGTLELDNRHNLGFDLTSTLCKIENRTRNVNVIAESKVSDFFEEVSKTFKVTLMNAPLLLGEKETYDVNFDGINKMSLTYSNAYNTYTLTQNTEEKKMVTMVALGERKRVAVVNGLSAKIVRAGNLMNFQVQNKNFLAAAGGRVMVKVEFMESIPLWPDRLMATQVHEIVGGDMNLINSKVMMKNPGRKHYLKISMQIVGSIYFNEAYSQILEFKE